MWEKLLKWKRKCGENDKNGEKNAGKITKMEKKKCRKIDKNGKEKMLEK